MNMLTRRRLCLHIHRRQAQYYSTTRGRYVAACLPCLHLWRKAH